eukprot:2309530-Prymnesium_polylepis.2
MPAATIASAASGGINQRTYVQCSRAPRKALGLGDLGLDVEHGRNLQPPDSMAKYAATHRRRARRLRPQRRIASPYEPCG